MNILIPLNEKTNICLSGGAIGADLLWGMTAGQIGHAVFHFVFEKHDSKAPQSELVVLSHDQLVMADPYLEKANDTLKRRWPANGYFVRSLLRRNWYQVQWASSLYAVSKIENGKVDGGTAWAVQMFIDQNNNAPCGCYVYDQIAEVWYKWEGKWVQIDEPPEPSGIWAGIGTRGINTSGKNAVKKLMRYSNL